MLSNLFSAEVLQETIEIVKGQFALAFWETLYVTVAAMFFAVLLGLPLGVLLVVGEKNGLAPLPGWLMKTLNVIINLLRSVPSVSVDKSHHRHRRRYARFHCTVDHRRLSLCGPVGRKQPAGAESQYH